MTAQVLVVIGGGTMGVDIAASFAAQGWATVIVNPPDARSSTIAQRFAAALARLGVHEPMPMEWVEHMERVQWDRVALVIEAVPENLALKRAIFAQLEQVAPAGIPLCSNSSAIPISRIGEGLASQHRMVGTHYFMPAHLVPGVEVIASEHTDPQVAERVAQLMASVGKVPIRVKRDLPGFLVNRLQHAVSREAMKLIDQGITTPEDVDAAVRFGFGFRYLAAGPCLQRDHAGLDVHHAAAQSIYPDLCNDSEPSRVLSDHVARGELGMKTGKGFYDWTEESTAAERKRYDDLLVAAHALLKGEIQSRSGG